MPKYALEDTSYELIKSHVLNPEQSPLNDEQQRLLDRVSSVARVLDKNPIQKAAVAIHMQKYPEISRSRAHLDVKLAMKLFPTIHNFQFDFWQTWLINGIVENIRRTRKQLSEASNERQAGALLRVIAQEHANLIKAIGEKPANIEDPQLAEKHQFIFVIQNNNQYTKIDLTKINEMSENTLRELNAALFAGKEISDTEAEEMMKS